MASHSSTGFPESSVGKESTCNAGDPGSIPGSGRSAGEGIGYPSSILGIPLWLPPAMQETWVQPLGWGGGKGYPLQCSGLENSMDCIVHGVTNSQTRLSDFHFSFTLVYLPGKSHGQRNLAGP